MSYISQRSTDPFTGL